MHYNSELTPTNLASPPLDQKENQNLRLQSDFLECHSFSGDFVLGFVHYSVSALSYLFHLLKRIHFTERMANGCFVVCLASRVKLARLHSLCVSQQLLGGYGD